MEYLVEMSDESVWATMSYKERIAWWVSAKYNGYQSEEDYERRVPCPAGVSNRFGIPGWLPGTYIPYRVRLLPPSPSEPSPRREASVTSDVTPAANVADATVSAPTTDATPSADTVTAPDTPTADTVSTPTTDAAAPDTTTATSAPDTHTADTAAPNTPTADTVTTSAPDTTATVEPDTIAPAPDTTATLDTSTETSREEVDEDATFTAPKHKKNKKYRKH